MQSGSWQSGSWLPATSHLGGPQCRGMIGGRRIHAHSVYICMLRLCTAIRSRSLHNGRGISVFCGSQRTLANPTRSAFRLELLPLAQENDAATVSNAADAEKALSEWAKAAPRLDNMVAKDAEDAANHDMLTAAKHGDWRKVWQMVKEIPNRSARWLRVVGRIRAWMPVCP